jgi:hypothetical protein
VTRYSFAVWKPVHIYGVSFFYINDLSNYALSTLIDYHILMFKHWQKLVGWWLVVATKQDHSIDGSWGKMQDRGFSETGWWIDVVVGRMAQHLRRHKVQTEQSAVAVCIPLHQNAPYFSRTWMRTLVRKMTIVRGVAVGNQRLKFSMQRHGNRLHQKAPRQFNTPVSNQSVKFISL